MKNIGIDARLYFQTGVGTYLRNFLNNLQEIAPQNLQFFVYVMDNESGKIQLNHANFIKRKIPYRWHSVSEQIGFLKTLYQDNLDLAHFTYFSYPVLYKKKFVATIHDTTPLFFKTGKASTKSPLTYDIKYFFFKQILFSQIKNAVKIITPTETVKKQLIRIYGNAYQKKIETIYEGVNEDLKNARENSQLSKKFEGNFFIYVGNFYPHKNIERLINAFTKIKGDTKLILIGPNDFFLKRLLQYINKLNCGNKVITYHNATSSDLVFFYKNARAIIHPSLSEGFGLPLLEAAYFGCPIIASNIEVFNELLDGQYLAFNPNNAADIFNKINYFLEKKPPFDYKEILKKYSFAKMTKEILKIYENNV